MLLSRGLLLISRSLLPLEYKRYRPPIHSRFPICPCLGHLRRLRERLSQVHLGEFADIHLNAYPDKVLKARIGNIGADHGSQYPHRQSPTRSRESRHHAAWHVCHGHFPRPRKSDSRQLCRLAPFFICMIVIGFTPHRLGRFQTHRSSGRQHASRQPQEIMSGIDPGTKVVTNALVLQNTVEQ